RAQARARVIETVCREWRHGRPRPVTTACLRESELITPRVWEVVVACAASHAWDGQALIAALRDREVSGFYQSTTEKLEVWFRDNEYIVDDIEPRQDTMIRAAAISAGNMAGGLEIHEIDALLRSMTDTELTLTVTS